MKILKRTSVLAASILLLLTGCQSQPQYSTENTYVEGQDYQYMYSDGNNNLTPNYIMETETAYYYMKSSSSSEGEFLTYIDKNTMEPVILCNRPDCRHDQETDEEKRKECNACFSTSMVPYYSGDMLYFYQPKKRSSEDRENGSLDFAFELAKMKPDGTERQVLSEQTGNPSFGFMHRGYYYYQSDLYTADGKSQQSGVYRVALQKNAEPELLYQAEEPFQITGMTAYGNGLYISEDGFENLGNYQSRCVRLDLLTKESEAVFEEDKGETQFNLIGFCDEKLLYDTFDLTSEKNGTKLYLAELDGSKMEEIEGAGDFADFCTDGKYIYRTPITWNPNYEAEDPNVAILDLSGNKIMSLSPEETEETTQIIPGNEKYLFRFAQIDGEEKLFYAEKSGIPSGKLEWKEIG